MKQLVLEYMQKTLNGLQELYNRYMNVFKNFKNVGKIQNVNE